jgi:hypothetical protein
MISDRLPDGRIPPRVLPDERLVAAVRKVAVLVDPYEPEALTQAQFDRAKATARYGHLPEARVIARRLGKSWRETVRYAVSGDEPPSANSLGRWRGERVASDLSEDEVRAALRAVRHHLGQRTLLPAAYERGRREMLAADRRRHATGGRLWLPTLGQVERVAREWAERDEELADWDNALALAGLPRRRKPEPPRPRSVADLLESCLDEVEALPSLEDLKEYARSRGWQFPRLAGTTWRAERDKVLATRRREGRPVPEQVPKRRRPSFTAPAPAGESERRNLPWTEERAVAGMILFLDAVTDGKTLRDYQTFAKGRREVASQSSLKPFGGYGRIKRLAERAIWERDGSE